MMDEETVLQIVDEFLSSLEPLDTHGAALMQFLKAKGIASDEELAPFIEQAGNASSVRWLAARVRMKSLISSALKDEEAKPPEAPTKQQKISKAESAQETKSSGKKAEAEEHKNAGEDGSRRETKGLNVEEQQAPNQDNPTKKKDELKPAEAVTSTLEKDKTKNSQAEPLKSHVKDEKEDAA